SSVRATDVDADAIEVAKENAARNGMAIDADTTDVTKLSGTWPIVLANIEPKVLIPMAPSLIDRVEPKGLLVLSGILATQEENVRTAYAHLEHVETRAKGEWVAIAYRKT